MTIRKDLLVRNVEDIEGRCIGNIDAGCFSISSFDFNCFKYTMQQNEEYINISNGFLKIFFYIKLLII